MFTDDNSRSQPTSAVPLIKRRILLAAQDAAVLLAAKAVLEMNDFAVDTASSARQAMEKMASGTYHMVIAGAWMDNETPGLKIIGAARRQPYRPATALLTTDAPPGVDWHGPDTVLIKPVGTEDFVRQIEVLLIRHEDEKRLRRPSLHLVEKHTAHFKGERRRKVS